jgi:hypothetical protein
MSAEDGEGGERRDQPRPNELSDRRHGGQEEERIGTQRKSAIADHEPNAGPERLGQNRLNTQGDRHGRSLTGATQRLRRDRQSNGAAPSRVARAVRSRPSG